MALTGEILIGLSASTAEEERMFAWLEHPVLARPSTDYTNSTGAFHHLVPKTDSPLSNYEAYTDRAIGRLLDDQEEARAYGQVNYGDWYGEGGASWGNNEYDTAYCAYVEFMRGGDPR